MFDGQIDVLSKLTKNLECYKIIKVDEGLEGGLHFICRGYIYVVICNIYEMYFHLPILRNPND